MVDIIDEAENTRWTRLEVKVPEDMRPWVRSAARRHGISESGLVRYLLAGELTRLFGPGWSDPSAQDHLSGDHVLNVVGDQGALK